MEFEEKNSEMAAEKKRIFSKGFKTGYLLVIGIFSAAICIALAVLWVFLDNYEKSSADNIANRVFNGYFFKLDAQRIFAFTPDSFCEFETFENFRTRLFEIAGNEERSIRAVPGEAEDSKKYVVLSGDEIFAEFEVTRNENARRTVWELSRISVVMGMLESYGVIVTAGSAVYVNGKPLGENHKTDGFASDDFAGALDRYKIEGFIAVPEVDIRSERKAAALYYDGEAKIFTDLKILTVDILDGSSLFINGLPVPDEYMIAERITAVRTDRLNLFYRRYKVLVAGASGEPVLRVVNKSGKDGILKTSDGMKFEQEVVYSFSLQSQFEALAIEAAMTYAKYMTNDTNLADVRRFFETGTVIYEAMRLAEVYWYIAHIGYWFENASAFEFYEHEEGIFSFRVVFDHYIERTEDVQMFKLDSTFFARQSGGRFLIFDMIPNI